MRGDNVKCTKCNFENDEVANYCSRCGAFIEKSVNVKKNVGKSFANKIFFGIFTIELILYLIFLFLELLPVLDCKAGACSGFFLLIVPVLIVLFSICLIMGWIVSIFNMIYNNKILTIIEAISCLLSVLILLSEFFEKCLNHTLHLFNIISLAVLMIVCLIKFIFELNNKNL